MKQFTKILIAILLATTSINAQGIIAEDVEDTTVEEVVITEEVVSQENTIDETTEENLEEVDLLSEAVSTSGAVKISIPDYDESVGWGAQRDAPETKTVQVTATFPDNTSPGKMVTISLPDGLKYSQILVVEGKYDSTSVDTALLSSLDANNPLALATENIILPTKEAITQSTFGELTYMFSPGTISATISFKVTSDVRKIMNSHTLNESIEATASMNGAVLESAQQEIDVVCTERKIIIHRQLQGTIETQANTSTETFVSNTDKLALERFNTYTKNLKLYYPYPEGAVVEGHTFSEINAGGNYTITHDEVNSRFIVEAIDSTEYLAFGAVWLYIEYSFPEGTTAGIYNAAPVSIEYETYNGEQKQVTAPYLYNVEVKDELLPKLLLTNGPTSHVDLAVPSLVPDGPEFKVVNPLSIPAKNQVVHYEIDPSITPRFVIFPYSSDVGNLSKIEYKIAGSDTWIVADQSVIDGVRFNTKYASLPISLLPLNSGEVVSEIRAWIGDLAANYTFPATLSEQGPGVYGELNAEPLVNKYITLHTYSEDFPSETKTTRSVAYYGYNDVNGQKVPSNSQGNFRTVNNAATTQIIAGESFKIVANLGIHVHPYGNQTYLQKPVIYLMEPQGMHFNTGSLLLTNSLTNEVITIQSIETSTDATGVKVYKVVLDENLVIGNMFDEARQAIVNTSVTVRMDVATEVKLTGAYPIADLMAFGSQLDINAISSYNHQPFDDSSRNIDGNSATTTLLSFPNYSPTLIIQENTNVLVETFLVLDGEEPQGAYIDGDAETISNFTPGTDADYTVKITNNSAADANSFVSYVPIPKTGENFGTWFQTEAFKWDLAITSEVDAVTGFEVKYAVGVDVNSYRDTTKYMTYSELITAGHSLSDVNMVRIEATQAIQPGVEVEFLIDLSVDETFASATSGNKIGTLNVYNPIYDVESVTFTGTLPGTKVGTELVLAEIGGLVFVDVDADGLYDSASGDTPIVGHEVELYVWDETTSAYIPAKNASGVHMKTTTNASGIYLFDYTNNLGYSTYAVRFVEKADGVYQYTINNMTIGKEAVNSDAIIANDIPNPGDTYRGWVLGINATTAEAKTIGAGFLEYNPPIDLIVELPDGPLEYLVDEVKTMTPVSIGPDFWENIKHETEAYTWEFVNPSDSQYISLTNTNKKTVGMTMLLDTPDGYTVELRLTIKDVYGNTASDTTTIIVKVAEPEITSVENDRLVFEYGDLIDEATILSRLGTIDGLNLEDAVFSIEGIENLDLRLLDDDQEVELVATTDNGESRAIITIVIQDTIAPEVVVEDRITYLTNDVIDEAQFLLDIGFEASDNYNAVDELVITTTFDTVDFSNIGSVVTVQITVKDSSGNETVVSVEVEILRAIQYHIEGEGFEITMEEYLDILNQGTVEDEIIVRSDAKAWMDHPVSGIEDLEVTVKNKDSLPTVVNYGDVIDGDLGLAFEEGTTTPIVKFNFFGFMMGEDPQEIQVTIPITILTPIYTVNFYDCDEKLIQQSWVEHGSNVTDSTTLAYPSVSVTNITKNTDAYPVNCSGGFVIPNTGNK